MWIFTSVFNSDHGTDATNTPKHSWALLILLLLLPLVTKDEHAMVA